MNKYSKGWALSTMLLMVSVIVIALLTSTFFTIRMNSLLGKNNNSSETKLQKAVNETYYINKMNEMTRISERYINDFNIDLTYGVVRINLSSLIELEYISPIYDSVSNNKCNGYIEAYLNETHVRQINSFLKCDNYTTPNYRD